MSVPTDMSRWTFLPILLTAFLVVTACDDSTAPVQDARIEVRLTDAPSDMLDSARVWISSVYLQGGSEDDAGEGDDADEPSGRTYLYEAAEGSEPKSFDLLELRDGVVADLAAADVPSGMYAQLRLVVDSARIYLTEGYEFEDGSTDGVLKIPSGSSSGIKVLLDRDIDAEAETTQIVVVDFDVNEAFRFPGLGSDGVIRQAIFLPVLKEMGRSSEDGTDG